MSSSRKNAASEALFGTPSGAHGRDAAASSQRDREQLKRREAAVKAEAEKTARLRALRLAKEADDAARAEDARRAKTSNTTSKRPKQGAKSNVAPAAPQED